MDINFCLSGVIGFSKHETDGIMDKSLSCDDRYQVNHEHPRSLDFVLASTFVIDTRPVACSCPTL